LREEFDDPRDRGRLTAFADLCKPVLTAIGENVKECPLEEDVVRESNGVPRSDVLQDAVDYELIDQGQGRQCQGSKADWLA
jgi:hypothetical protein